MTTIQDVARRQPGPSPEKERAAQGALEACAGRTLSDAEWARARLLQFVSILRDWHREATASESELRKAA